MAFVRVIKVGKHEYAQICESVYEKDKKRAKVDVIKSLGNIKKIEAKDPDYLKKLKAALEQAKEQKHETNLDEVLASFEISNRTVEGKEHQRQADWEELYLGEALLKSIWKKFNMKSASENTALDHLTFFLVAQRILNPASKYETFNKRDQSILNHDEIYDLNMIYRGLDKIGGNKERLNKALNTAISKETERDLTIGFYDVTTYAFESRNVSELKQFGLSKDNKVGEVQVVLGLIMDSNGIPIDYDIWPGNTSEFKTLLPIVKRVIKTYNIKKLTLVADRGLNSSENLLELQNLGISFVLAQKIKQCSKEEREFILNNENWRNYAWTPEGELIWKCKTLKINKTIYERKVSEKTGKSYQTSKVIGEIPVSWIITHSAKRERKDRTELNRAIEKAQKAIDTHTATAKGHGFKALISIPRGEGEPSLDMNKIAETQKWAGFYAICTDRTDLSPEEVQDIYKQLWRIEDCFRISKTNLQSRPIFVWKDERIKGHFQTCFMALVLEKYIEYMVRRHLSELNPTTESILTALKEAKVTKAGERKTVYLRVKNDGLFDEMLKLFGLTPLQATESPTGVRRALKIRSIN